MKDYSSKLNEEQHYEHIQCGAGNQRKVKGEPYSKGKHKNQIFAQLIGALKLLYFFYKRAGNAQGGYTQHDNCYI